MFQPYRTSLRQRLAFSLAPPVGPGKMNEPIAAIFNPGTGTNPLQSATKLTASSWPTNALMQKLVETQGAYRVPPSTRRRHRKPSRVRRFRRFRSSGDLLARSRFHLLVHSTAPSSAQNDAPALEAGRDVASAGAIQVIGAFGLLDLALTCSSLPAATELTNSLLFCLHCRRIAPLWS